MKIISVIEMLLVVILTPFATIGLLVGVGLYNEYVGPWLGVGAPEVRVKK